MEAIYHLLSRQLWDRQTESDYRADSLATEGFIHCSFAHQLAWAANRFHAETEDLIALEIDVSRLKSELKVEPPSPTSTSSELFPHVYGPINRDAVVDAHVMRRNAQGQWEFSR